ncbi:hypothetical protein Q5H91_09905 [Sphingomonas sp. KR1UV-12]|uniref:Uncharacterized protein n=1 Tax=Sphingomonas aurea TaxID=3063994 RepID=A0ABT9EL55_9SPHN|nr:hypothetical protein [Sphingomonas sp. KR1UV-12]MDP1027526.1 hypothetical protein [Sphingomonas sp. KR1UV-12]
MIGTAALLLAIAPVAGQADAGSNVAAIDRAVAACERWLLDPASWSDDIAAFGRAEGLEPQDRVPDVALPPPAMRMALHYWRVPVGKGGIYVTTSDRLPFCHLSGGGPADLQPAVAAAVGTPAFARHWRQTGTGERAGMTSWRFVSTADPAMTMTLSSPASAGGPTDRVQLLATIQYQTGN